MPVAASTRPFSPADSVLSVVPDSQAPEPAERPPKRFKGFDEHFRVPVLRTSRSHPHRPTAPSPLASYASSSIFEQPSVRSVAKSEVKDEEEWSGGTTSHDQSSTSSRARAPSPDDKRRIKREIKAELAEEEERALLYRSRVNAVRSNPDRRKERAPSLENQLKKEEPADDDSKHIERDYSTSEEDDAAQGELSNESDEYEPSEPNAGTPMPIDDQDDASAVASVDGTVGRRRNDLTKRQPRKRKKVLQKAKTKKQVEADTLHFLEGIDLPAPKHRPLSVKARLVNELARVTAIFPRQGRVEPVELPPPRRPPSDAGDGAVKDDQDLPSRSASRRADGAPHQNGNGPAARRADGASERHESPADSLEEYVDQDDPEIVFQPKFEEIDLLQNQAYFEKPTRHGAVTRWITLLEKDSGPLPPAFSYPVVSADCTTLESLGITIHHDLVLSRDFQDDSAEVLISHCPSTGVCALLWRDLTDSSHAERHQAAAGEGRRCCCPLWVPQNRREWDEELDVLARKYGLGAQELGEVLDVAFWRRENAVVAEDDDLLEHMYKNNWLWYSQIVQLALIRRAYSSVTSRTISDAILNYQSDLKDCIQQERRRLQRRRDQGAQAARERGRLPNIEFHQDLLAFEAKAQEKLENLAALRERLDSARKADQTTGNDETDCDDAASIATAATYGPARITQTIGNVDN
ncbi:hypothetical protein Rt10032_c01g0024 [Rhodotorula toruloides]|uniref:Uncharacterized protein n=1 Tax=Rhodotorula toruloides TaxID=5286 RepID=A0A511K6U4_RHOTO|nr:hypothetical protein Rt10032_c01g0024 [Rhodotorula toruloides]